MKQNQITKFNSWDILVREHRNKVPQFLRIKEVLSDERLNVIRLQVFMDDAASKFCEDGMFISCQSWIGKSAGRMISG